MIEKVKTAYLSIPAAKRWRLWATAIVGALGLAGVTLETTKVLPIVELLSPVVLSLF